MLKLHDILLQYLKFNQPYRPLQIFYLTFKIKHIIACCRFIRPFRGEKMTKIVFSNLSQLSWQVLVIPLAMSIHRAELPSSSSFAANPYIPPENITGPSDCRKQVDKILSAYEQGLAGYPFYRISGRWIVLFRVLTDN